MSKPSQKNGKNRKLKTSEYPVLQTSPAEILSTQGIQERSLPGVCGDVKIFPSTSSRSPTWSKKSATWSNTRCCCYSHRETPGDKPRVEFPLNHAEQKKSSFSVCPKLAEWNDVQYWFVQRQDIFIWAYVTNIQLLVSLWLIIDFPVLSLFWGWVRWPVSIDHVATSSPEREIQIP